MRVTTTNSPEIKQTSPLWDEWALANVPNTNQLTQEELDSIPLLDPALDEFLTLPNEFTPEQPSSSNFPPELRTTPGTNACVREMACSRKDLLAVSVRWLEEDGMHYSLGGGLTKNQVTQEELDSIYLLDFALDPGLAFALAPPDELAPKNPGSQDLLPNPRTPPETQALAQNHRRVFASPEDRRSKSSRRKPSTKTLQSPTALGFVNFTSNDSQKILSSRRKPSTKTLQSPTALGFVNFTPNDSQKILAGVAPSGSSKTKARREQEANDRKRRMSLAAEKAVLDCGGDWKQFRASRFLK